MTASQPVSRPRNLVPAFQSAFRQTQSTCFNIQRRPWNRFVNEIGSAHLQLVADALDPPASAKSQQQQNCWPASMCQKIHSSDFHRHQLRANINTISTVHKRAANIGADQTLPPFRPESTATTAPENVKCRCSRTEDVLLVKQKPQTVCKLENQTHISVHFAQWRERPITGYYPASNQHTQMNLALVKAPLSPQDLRSDWKCLFGFTAVCWACWRPFCGQVLSGTQSAVLAVSNVIVTFHS